MNETKFITKWALTHGIVKSDAQLKESDGWHCRVPSGYKIVGINHIHDTLEQAQVKAEEMRLAEIERLKAKIVTLQKLRF
jgi:hypothetical protein